ncbi:hypothetical protein Ahy_B05g078806 [Arachis hypogaea]|uniref:Reverse transcriptase zinc-binding domain-containing protein n=1 Tax=Arachis hypogaea TaxID=3818 RepID=A0A444Z838_ARAHY|nr:hypothetical protein Ahy_B05g078806 [Arachis hypogaea]
MEMVVSEYMKRMERDRWDAFNTLKDSRRNLEKHVVRENLLFNPDKQQQPTEEPMENTGAKGNQVRHLDVAMIDAGGGGTLIASSSRDQGVGRKAFPSLIRDLRHEYRANLFFLLETHVSGIQGNQIRDKIGFDQSFVVDATGHARGIWCLWDSSIWKVDVLEHDRQFIHLKISGWPFTWKRGNLAERLDRRLSNLDCQIKFPERGIYASWENVECNCIWRIGDGTRIRFWNHHWVPGARHLSDSSIQVSSGFNSSEMLMDFCDISEQWDVGKLQWMLPENIVKKIIAISPPSPWKEADHIVWGPSSDGTFSAKSAYQVTMEEQHTQNKNFRLVWNWQGLERIRTFLWLVTHNAILTNSERKRRHLTNDDSCPQCQCHEESAIHVLRDCFYAKSIWQKLFPPNGINYFFNTDLNEWLLQNLMSNNTWSFLFGVAVSSI